MAITVDGSTEYVATSETIGSTSPTTLSSVAVPALTNGLGIVLVCYAYNRNITGITWNSVAMTQAASASALSSNRRVYAYYLVAPANNGNYNIVVSYDGSDASALTLGVVAVWCSGVAQSSPLDDTSEYNDQSVGTMSVVVTPSEGNELCLAISHSDANQISDPPNDISDTTLQWEDFGGFCYASNYDIPSGSGDKTLSVAYNQTEDVAAVGITFKQAAVAGLEIPIAMHHYKQLGGS